MQSKVNRNYTIKTSAMCLTEDDLAFQSNLINFFYFFCEQVENEFEEEDCIQKLNNYVCESEKNNKINSQLILFTRNCILGSFMPSMDRLCFRHFKYSSMGCIDNNCFVESENSALSRDNAGPKSNHRLHVATDAIIGHTRKRFVNEFSASCITYHHC